MPGKMGVSIVVSMEKQTHGEVWPVHLGLFAAASGGSILEELGKSGNAQHWFWSLFSGFLFLSSLSCVERSSIILHGTSHLILFVFGLTDIISDADADGSSILCPRCGDLVSRARKKAHDDFWCSANENSDSEWIKLNDFCWLIASYSSPHTYTRPMNNFIT